MSKELKALEVLQNYIMVNEPLETQEPYLQRLNAIRKVLTPPTEENDSKVYLKEHSFINLASGAYTSLDLEHDNNKYFITGYGDSEARLEISYETAVKIIKDLRCGVI